MEGPRELRPGEFQGMLELLNSSFPESLPEGIQAHWPHVCVERPDCRDRYRVFVDAGRPVSCVGVVPMRFRVDGGTLDVGGVSIVATDPDYRGRGLMTALLKDATETMRSRGHAASWLNGDRTRYGRLGWERAGRKYNVVLSRRSTGGLRPSGPAAALLESRGTHLEEMERLYGANPLGGVRAREVARRLFARPGKKTIACQEGDRVIGYHVA